MVSLVVLGSLLESTLATPRQPLGHLSLVVYAAN